jgi:hypothetical protein
MGGRFTQVPVHSCPYTRPTCNDGDFLLAGTDKRLIAYDATGASLESTWTSP